MPTRTAAHQAGSAPPRLLVSLATYNEADNLRDLVAEIHAVAPHAVVLVIDDNSPDGTGKIADELKAASDQVDVIHRAGKQGLGTAIIAAMRYAVEHHYDYFLNMDASVDIFAGQGSVAAGRAGSYDNPESRGAGERCLTSFGRNAGPPMFPNGWYNNNYDFIQTPTEVAITVEMVHDMRHIRLNSKHRTDGIRPWFGDSIGWWDGDTLVVETTNIPQRMAYDGAWEHLTVTERFTRVGKNRMAYQFSIKDPTIWDKPWGGEYEFYPLKGDTHEYACHEGNYALAGILAGAREEEKMAASKSGPVAAK